MNKKSEYILAFLNRLEKEENFIKVANILSSCSGK